MIPPIPKRVLVHTAELITKYGADKWGKASTSETAKLERVRIEPTSKAVTDAAGTVIQLSAVLFFDCRNSAPKGVIFALKDDYVNGKTVDIQQVKFNGRIFTVTTIEPLYADTSEIHHYEVGLA